jgi:hypothetical protein
VLPVKFSSRVLASPCGCVCDWGPGLWKGLGPLFKLAALYGAALCPIQVEPRRDAKRREQCVGGTLSEGSAFIVEMSLEDFEALRKLEVNGRQARAVQ